jgi:nickel/cobalt transporter (NicO) family protein
VRTVLTGTDIRQCAPALLAVITIVLALGQLPAIAHPLGNFTINHYAAIDARPDGLRIGYVLDMAEIPTFQELAHLDQAGIQRHLAARLPEWAQDVHLFVNGVPAPLRLQAARVSCLPGVGGLPILRVEEDLWADGGGLDTSSPSGSQPVDLTYRDDNFPNRAGWKEIIVTGPLVQSSSVPAIDRGSDRLRSYPVDLLQSPPEDTVARFRIGATPRLGSPNPARGVPSISMRLSGCRIAPGETVAAAGGQIPGPRYVAESTAFGGLFKRLLGGSLSFEILAFVILGAFVLGAYHALTPGHGKAILAAYFIGSRGTPSQAVLLGIVVTLTHTTGVFVLGFASLVASRYVLPEKLFPWLSVLSGIILVGLGSSLFWRRLQALHGAHDHRHEHEHDHGDDHHAHRDHGHGRHHHLCAEEPIRPRDLIALGITGGMLPCPSALVVMLAAISVGQVGFGLLLIAVFSLGLAAVLTAAGLLMVYSKSFMSRLLDSAEDARMPLRGWQFVRPMLRRLPVFSAAAVAALGAVIVIQTIVSLGLIR